MVILKKQVLVMHGGTTWSTYEDYFKYLEDYSLERILEKSGKRWKDTLPEVLGEGYDVVSPSMPSSKNSKYIEWKLWFEKYFPILQNDIILIGHSLGATFLLKYLTEEALPVSVSQLHLVAVPLTDTKKEQLCSFKLKNFKLKASDEINLEHTKIGKVFVYHSQDDEIAPFSDGQKCHEAIRQSEFVTFENYGHFVVENFPELVQRITTSH